AVIWMLSVLSNWARRKRREKGEKSEGAARPPIQLRLRGPGPEADAAVARLAVVRLVAVFFAVLPAVDFDAAAADFAARVLCAIGCAATATLVAAPLAASWPFASAATDSAASPDSDDPFDRPRAPAAFALFAAVFAAAFGARGSNAKPTLPSGPSTRYALNLRRVRAETKSVSRSVRPSASSLRICAGATSCCRMTLPLRKSQRFPAPTAFSQP